jgi:hypothetical protein
MTYDMRVMPLVAADTLTPQSARFTWMSDAGELSDTQRGRPVLELKIGDAFALITAEQKLLSNYGLDLVFLGARWEDALGPITLLRDSIAKDLPAGDEILRGFTKDPTIVRLTKHLLDEVNRGVFHPRALPIFE